MEYKDDGRIAQAMGYFLFIKIHAREDEYCSLYCDIPPKSIMAF